ncbi:sensor histidine kinase [Bacillus sp. MUM 13]|uniref:sensor histidine kinase n=1 Tax=Bacillus sp. MUM 13 TaxID=1678001 RepID=UPI0008F59A18|nr:sensor histidine kinase [Bacillus sp. MUM 13]OIK14647.1 hypothetical protein BIV59_02525 [Bacillus sp. MUM 13]
MKLIPDRFKHNGIFIIMFLITVLSIITVTITITWTVIRMSENFFIDKFSITNSKVMDQIKDSFESFNYSVVIASNNLLQSGNLKKSLTAKESDTEKMFSIYNIGEQVKRIKSNLDAYDVGIIVLGKNGTSFATNRNYWPISDEELKNSPITRKTLKVPKRLIYQQDKRPELALDSKDKNFIVASRALMERISGKIYGSMYFSIQERKFRKFYSKYTSPGNNVFLINKAGLIVSSSQTGMIGQKANDLLGYRTDLESHSRSYTIGKFMGHDQIILMEYLPSFDMYLFNTIDKKTAIGDLINKKAIAMICMSIVFVALIIVFLLSRRLTDSLSRLVKQISNAPKNDFHQFADVSGTYETRQIGKAFNSMLDELHEYVGQLVLAQKQQRTAELEALQQQINPHFLYNTLTSIKFMVWQGKKEETEAVINALISLLQNTIGNVNETVTVQKEMENLKNYVFINQTRYGNRIKVNYFIEPDCMEFQLPKLILQPFIENSFFHGFNHKAGGYINVLVWRDGENMICEVADNGDGMKVTGESDLPNTRRKRQLFSGIGVRNVNDRIQLIYGEEYGVTISSEPGEGTKVRIVLPISRL